MREQIERMLAQPGQELSRLGRFLRFQFTLWKFCARRLHENNLFAMSAALSFRTIFALIPVIVLVFLGAKSLGVLEDSKHSLRQVLAASGFAQIAVFEADPADGDPLATPSVPGSSSAPASDAASQPSRVINVAEKIEETVAAVESKLTFERLGPVGGLLFIWTALTLLMTVEESLNRIFGAPRSRAMARRVLLYWSAVTLVPIALAAATYLGRIAVDACSHIPGVSGLVLALGFLGPVLVGVVVLAGVYKLMPNTQVRFRAALGGAAIAVALWLLAKWGFTLYVERFVVKGNLYGVLGVFPLFMMWLNLSWTIFLFGAEFAHTTANLARLDMAERARRIILGPSAILAAAAVVARQFSAGRGFATLEQVAETLGLPPESADWLLSRLCEAGLVTAVDAAPPTRYALTRPPDQIPVAAIRDLGDPRAGATSQESVDPSIREAVDAVHDRTRSAISELTLADLLDSAAGAAKPLGREAVRRSTLNV